MNQSCGFWKLSLANFEFANLRDEIYDQSVTLCVSEQI